VVRDLVAGVLEHGRPEQGVEVDDVLADEVDHLGAVCGKELGEAAGFAFRLCLSRIEVVFQRGKVSDWRISQT